MRLERSREKGQSNDLCGGGLGGRGEEHFWEVGNPGLWVTEEESISIRRKVYDA